MTEKVVIGGAELWHGDCREILPVLEACAVVSDPPYGIGYAKGAGGKGCHSFAADGNRNRERIIGDDAPFDPAHLLGFDPVVLFGADHFAQRLPRGRWLVWDKLGGKDGWDSFSDIEVAWHNRPGAARIFRLMWKGLCQGAGKDKGTKRTHPTQKPVALMEWCIKHAGNPETVCDPYMGSGTTGVACMNLQRQFIGIEREPKYFDIACRRIDDAQRQVQMFR